MVFFVAVSSRHLEHHTFNPPPGLDALRGITFPIASFYSFLGAVALDSGGLARLERFVGDIVRNTLPTLLDLNAKVYVSPPITYYKRMLTKRRSFRAAGGSPLLG